MQRIADSLLRHAQSGPDPALRINLCSALTTDLRLNGTISVEQTANKCKSSEPTRREHDAVEMVPFDPLVGEFRVHYAGFFDPGFGHAAAGGSGAKAVLEVRSHKVPFILEDGQIVGRLIYERVTEVPEILYGSDLKSNYQGQGLKLSKHFK